ncbi:MAG TPA: nuclear transport factor 2 family protein [Lapillicoccus sp.]|nr:nuclear transport factor 2 family protein [Lapillicoccus sp.]
MEPADVATSLLRAFNDGDLDRMRELMDPGLVAWVTDAAGEPQAVAGADAYLGRIAAMNLPAVSYRVTPTQDPVSLENDLILLMVEVTAERDGRRLHNFAAHVLRLRDGLVTEWRMADAKPAESDRFWS